jgi:hypothetical protein
LNKEAWTECKLNNTSYQFDSWDSWTQLVYTYGSLGWRVKEGQKEVREGHHRELEPKPKTYRVNHRWYKPAEWPSS